MDLGSAPIGILFGQATDQVPQFLGNPGSAATRSGAPAPVETEAGAVPPDDGFGFDDDERIGQRPQKRRRMVQKRRSQPFSRGRGRLRLRTATGWRQDFQGGIRSGLKENAEARQARQNKA